MKKSIIDELSEQLARLMPQANALGDDIKANVKTAMEKTFTKMDLLTREEFDAQVRALRRAEQKIAELEEAVKKLEARSNDG
jgi:ubiquinone biosynthesis accessory factor UbiK